MTDVEIMLFIAYMFVVLVLAISVLVLHDRIKKMEEKMKANNFTKKRGIGMTKEEAIDWIKSIKDKYIHGGDDDFDEKRKKSLDMAIKALEQEKADETTDRPEWIDYQDGQWIYAKCPVCGSVRNTKTPFCPICGKKMKGVIGK